MRGIVRAIAFWIVFWSAPALASSCYDLPAVASLRHYASQAPQSEVTFLLDQTVTLPELARRQILDEVVRFANARTIIDIGSFSSFSGARFPAIDTRYVFEPDLPPADEANVSRRARTILKACLAYRHRAGVELLQRALQSRFSAARSTIGQSDIMSSLQQFGTQVASSPARERVVFVASDMLENSSSASFYKDGRLRPINPGQELRRAADHKLFANFASARIYVIGMALQPAASQATTPVEAVQRLEQFWNGYFRRSNASHVIFGKPLLLQDAY